MRDLAFLAALAFAPLSLSAQDAKAKEKALEKQIGDRLSESIVAIRNAEGFGTGMVLTEKGLILTNAHVVCSPMPFYVTAVGKVDGQRKDLRFDKVSLLGVHPEYDLALLQIDPAERKAELRPFTIAESRITNGERIWTMGYPSDVEGGRRKVLTGGTVKNTERRLYGDPYLELDLSVYFGNSGGPLVDVKGEVVGVVTAMLEDGGSLAVPISLVKPERFVPLRQRAPNHSVSTLFLTEAQKESNRSRAITYYQQALIYDASNAELYAKFGQFYFLARQYEFSVAYYVRSLQMSPWRDNGVTAYRQLGLALVALGKPAETIVIWEEGLRKYPKDNTILWEEIALLLMKEGALVEAACSARTALKCFSKSPDQMNAIYKKAREKMSPGELGRLREYEAGIDTLLDGRQADADRARREGKEYLTAEAEKLIRSYAGVQQTGTINAAKLGLRKEPEKLDVTDAELTALFIRSRIGVATEHLQAGRIDAAAEILEDVLKAHPGHPEAQPAKDLLRIIRKSK